MNSATALCPLCESEAHEFITNYFLCGVCDLRFLDPQRRLNRESEKQRYDLHENNFEDPRYREFLRPLAQAVREKLAPPRRGLDFGSGAAPVLADILKQMGFEMFVHDPFFHPDSEVFQRRYDFICASEVVEHLYEPQKEFARLRQSLNGSGLLALMTAVYTPSLDFESWYYRKDPTHVVFYSARTLKWIQQRFLFSWLEIKDDRVVLLGI